MTGNVIIVGVGPGNRDQITPEAIHVIETAEVFFGYGPYLDRLDLKPGQVRYASDNREELARAREALECALGGKAVCVVSGGDPGVFAMAAAIYEAVDNGPPEWRTLEIKVVPGLTAMLAVAARCGAPLGHDFCAISLSDNLKPWSLVEKRLKSAAEAGFVMAFYNPISRARPWQLGEAFSLLRKILSPQTPVIFGRAIGRSDERVEVKALADADPGSADMATCVIIGSPETRIIRKGEEILAVYTPRFAESPK